jgi:serine/threonine protein kinase
MSAKRVGEYEIGRVLARGGMGILHEAVHVSLRKRVALKMLDPHAASDEARVRRFLKEGRAASRIRHPHVLDITDVGTADGVPFLVMELLEGEDLAARLAREGRLSPEQLVEIALPICSALEAVHASKVVHRDLKPENVFLARNGHDASVHVKLVDFGIAALADHPSTGAKTLAGTVPYMAPEQFSSSAKVDARADQYALGVILYQCVTGRRPFDGTRMVAVMESILAGDYVPARDLAPSLPADLDAVIARAMSVRADDRFASMHDIGRALLPAASPRVRLKWAGSFGAASMTPEAPSPRSAPLVVCIDDDDDVRDNQREILEGAGFTVVVASNGEEGVALVRAHRPDVVLCDVSMPGMSGYDVLGALRENKATARIPFVFVSARAERSDVRTGMNLGADDYVTKPFSRSELIDAVQGRVARSRPRPAPRDETLASAETMLANETFEGDTTVKE